MTYFKTEEKLRKLEQEKREALALEKAQREAEEVESRKRKAEKKEQERERLERNRKETPQKSNKVVKKRSQVQKKASEGTTEKVEKVDAKGKIDGFLRKANKDPAVGKSIRAKGKRREGKKMDPVVLIEPIVVPDGEGEKTDF